MTFPEQPFSGHLYIEDLKNLLFKMNFGIPVQFLPQIKIHYHLVLFAFSKQRKIPKTNTHLILYQISQLYRNPFNQGQN